MPGIRKRGVEIRDYILANITGNKNIAALTAKQFEISLTAVYKHFDRLVKENQILKKNGFYVLHSKQCKYVYINNKTLREDAVWENDIKKHFINVPKNVWGIWAYGFLEMFNNAIEHSMGEKIQVIIDENKIFVTLSIADDGIGIFKNIKENFNLTNEKDALLELAKGKRTTDSVKHSGQGIFFTSKAFDDFMIVSNGIVFGSKGENIKPKQTSRLKFSTLVYIGLANNSSKILIDVFNEFSTEIPGDFDKTIIPVHLANSTDLVSRSQARRILSGLELFKEVVLDFKDVEYIGQAFADEVFRVFVNMNPDTSISTKNTNTEIQNMISRAVNTKLQ